MTEKTDHDLLTENALNIEHITELIEKNTKVVERNFVANTKTHKKIFDRLETKASDRTFKWTSLIIIGVTILLFGAVGIFSIDVIVNKKSIMAIEHMIDNVGAHG